MLSSNIAMWCNIYHNSTKSTRTQKQCVAKSICKSQTTKLAPKHQCNVKYWVLNYT